MLQKPHELEKDKLVQLNQHKIVVTQQGKLFVRIIAAAIDARLLRQQSGNNTFSKAI